MIPRSYEAQLDVIETQRAIKYIKDLFETSLAEALNLTRVSAPIAVLSSSGINDSLSGVEKPISFHSRDIRGKVEIVQSLAKWKRWALAEYGFQHGEGIYTDMNALRPDEVLDNLHSVYVDQWDWERIIAREERDLEFLKYIVGRIYQVIVETERVVCRKYQQISGPCLPDEVHYVHSEDLEKRYPDLSPREREDAICREKKAVFLIGIGANLASGTPHDGRAPDYDDWSTETAGGRKGLNGDILVWYPLLNCAMELSSMGIRVDRTSLLRQLETSGQRERAGLPFHQRLLAGGLPLTVGGGIGQSRLCMLYLRKAHVGEVQSSVWPVQMRETCRKNGIRLL